ncbi:MAG: hypothetical protein ACXWQZ_07985 [Ktedonobacterales bacterium]
MDDTSFIEAINHAQGLGREAARPVYEELWESATRAHDQYHCCIVAHFMAHAQVEAEAQRAWHLRALHAADAVYDERVTSFYPSLYGNLPIPIFALVTSPRLKTTSRKRARVRLSCRTTAMAA